MSATYRVTYAVGTQRDSLVMHAADAKNMKRASIKEATRNAARRALDKLQKRHGRNVKVVRVECIG